MNKLWNRSLKTKWMLTTGLTIFISYAAICIVTFFALQSWLLSAEEQNATRTAEDLSSFFASQGFAVTIQDLQNQSGLMQAILTQDQTVRLFHLDGREILQINNAAPAVALPAELRHTHIEKMEVAGVDAFVIHRAVQIGPLHMILQLVHPLTAFQSMMSYILTTMFLLGIGGILLAAGMSYLASTLLIRPLQDLRNSMEAVKEGGFASKVDFTYTAQDEIGDLVIIYEEMLAKLEQSFTRQQQFVSDASHELRTPIQSLEGHLSLMKRWGKDDPEVLEESLATSLQDVGRMKKILEELLQLARQENLSQHATANVVEVLAEVEREMRFIYPHATLDRSVVGQIKEANITAEALGQVIRNIYENAIRYCERKPLIHTALHFKGEDVFIEVTDNGIGIAEENIPYVFDRFFKVDDARLHVEGSTGLGLSITKMLIDKYNGDIEVHSQIGKGSVFLLRIPLKL